MWHEKKVIAWLLRDLTISRVHMQYKRLSPMPWYLPKARSLGIHRIHRPLYGANDRLIVVDTIGKHVTVDIHNHRVHEMRPSAYLREVERFLKPLIAYEK